MTLLDPHRDRTLYTRALTPPPGCRFDCAVALTYSLNLDMLLAVPLHLLLHAGDRPDSELLADPVALLYGLRQTTDGITIFHHRGGIHPPRRSTPRCGCSGFCRRMMAMRTEGRASSSVWPSCPAI